MARVRNIEVEDVSGDARAVYERIQRDYGPFGNMLRVFAHRPPALRHIYGWFQSLPLPRHRVRPSSWANQA